MMRWILFRLLRLSRMPIFWNETGSYGLTEHVLAIGKARGAGVSHCWKLHFGRRSWRVSPRFAARDAFLREHLAHKADVQ